ncbi:hypothetical protein PVAP13_2NG560003 [Panicum virgatum]|uniref:Uncharacterized protein n=1 Tax=Panicum virgatum TaxID=38727 RepID=A0A8T0VMD8_PANVG|nr:hypothetical protein PVAP13_2NG560003 [Panicum virgatum]
MHCRHVLMMKKKKWMHLSRTLLIDACPWEQSDVVVLHADLLGVLSWCC